MEADDALHVGAVAFGGRRDHPEDVEPVVLPRARSMLGKENRRAAERYALFLWPALALVLLEVLLASTRLRSFP